MTTSSRGAREGGNGRERHTKRMVPVEIEERLAQQDGKARVYAPDLKVSPARMEKILEEEARENDRKILQAEAQAEADKRWEQNRAERRELVERINALHVEKQRLVDKKEQRGWFARLFLSREHIRNIEDRIKDIEDEIKTLQKIINRIDIDHEAYSAG